MLDRRRFTTLSAVVLASLLSAATASAALQAYISIKGTKQGQIKASESASKTDTNAFRIESYKIVDPAGAPAGKRRHAPIVITKEVDSASPKLFQAFQSSEPLAQVVIKAADPDKKGSGVTVDLANGRVLKIEHVVADAQHSSLSKTKQYEEISFSYQKITVAYEGGTTESDDWETHSQ